MQIDKETVRKLAHLARLEFDENSAETMVNDMNRMLDFVAKLDAIDVSQVEPLIYMNEDVNVWRKDEVINTITHEEALKNAPKKDTDFFRVPKVIEK